MTDLTTTIHTSGEYLLAAAAAADRWGDTAGVGARLRDLAAVVPGDGDLNADDRRTVAIYLIAASNCAEDHDEAPAIAHRLRALASHEATLYGRARREERNLADLLDL